MNDKARQHILAATIIILFILCVFSPFYSFPVKHAKAADTNYYVKNGGSDSASGLNDANAWATIGKVVSEFGGDIDAGDNIYFNRGDTFTDAQLTIGLSGVSDADRLIIGAYGTGEKPIFYRNNGTYGIYMTAKNYITIENLTIDWADRLIRLESDCDYVTIQNCNLTNSPDGWGSIYVYGSGHSYLSILNNYIYNGHGDVVEIRGTTYGLIEGNTIIGGPDNDHSCLMVRTGCSYIMIRDNIIYDGNDDNAQYVAATSHLVFEDNIVYGTSGAGLKIHGGDGHIIRNNLIYNCDGAGIGGWKNDAGGSVDTKNCVWYHNTIYDLGDGNAFYDGGFRYTAYAGTTKKVYNNVIKNNIFHTLNPNGISISSSVTPFTTYFYNNVYENNNIYGASTDIRYGVPSVTYTVATAESAYPAIFINNTDTNPQFVDAANYDFELTSISPCIDAAAWLTLCNGGGTGTSITVDNADYFFAGISALDVGGDEITVGTDDVTITAVNYATNVITVTPSITWVNNDPVSLRYNDSTPDIGAKETAEEGEWVNSAPTLSSEVPTNASISISKYPQLNITITDADGNNSEVYWYTNASGSWYLMQTNNSVLNTTVRLMNYTNVSSYSTKYWWRVSANDTHDNTTEIYHFTTKGDVNVPTQNGEIPTNGSTAIHLYPACNVTCNDIDGDSLTVYFYENTTGSWVLQQTNSSHTANTSAVWGNYTNASSYVTWYWWSVNLTGSWTNATYSFTTKLNVVPVITSPIPRNGRLYVSIYTANVSIVITDANSDFNYTIETNPDVGSISENNVDGGVKTCVISGLAYSTTYTWYVNATDNTTLVRASYTFTTKGSTDFDLEDFKLNLPEWAMGPYKVYVGDFVWMFLFVGMIAITWGSSKHISSVFIVILLTFAAYGTQRVFVDNSEISLLFSIIAAICIAAIMLGLFLKKRHG